MKLNRLKSLREWLAAMERIGEDAKAGFGIPKILVVEDDFDVTDVSQVMWAFANRAHPSRGEIYFPDEAQNILPVFLTDSEKSVFKTTKVVHNALLADRFAVDHRPMRSDLDNAWQLEIRWRVIARRQDYGYTPTPSLRLRDPVRQSYQF